MGAVGRQTARLGGCMQCTCMHPRGVDACMLRATSRAHQVSDAGVVQQLEAFGDDEGMSC